MWEASVGAAASGQWHGSGCRLVSAPRPGLTSSPAASYATASMSLFMSLLQPGSAAQSADVGAPTRVKLRPMSSLTKMPQSRTAGWRTTSWAGGREEGQGMVCWEETSRGAEVFAHITPPNSRRGDWRTSWSAVQAQDVAKGGVSARDHEWPVVPTMQL